VKTEPKSAAGTDNYLWGIQSAERHSVNGNDTFYCMQTDDAAPHIIAQTGCGTVLSGNRARAAVE